jgi:DNA-binding transcriptional MocR family regulator
MSLLTTSHTNSIASLYLTSLLTWSQLPTLLALNSERLTESYRVLARAFQQWNIDFVTPTDGIFIFAKLAKNVRTFKDEAAAFERLAKQGVIVAPGRFFHGVETDLGWARIRFSIPVGTMNLAVQRIGAFLSLEG